MVLGNIFVLWYLLHFDFNINYFCYINKNDDFINIFGENFVYNNTV